jgi:hypothetical protein
MCSSRRKGLDLLFVLFFVTLPVAVAAGAQEEPPPSEEPAAEEEETGLKVGIHGYLTQAYAQSDGHQFFGITEDGTADYRTAALQIRADISSKDTFVVQFSHERFGESRIQEIKDDVELDWLFYEHRFGDTALKVGRIQIPFGIYNEVRDVGTLLPFYRPSHNFYGEVAYSSETVDGAVLSRKFSLGGEWRLETDLHYGDWEFVQSDFLTGTYSASKVNDSKGVELWLDTPVSGLRFGLGGIRYDIESPTGQVVWQAYHISVAGDFDRFSFHGEYKDVDIDFGHVLQGYVHLGVNLTSKISLNAQKDFGYFDDFVGLPRTEFDDDRIAGINYAFNPSLVLKAEHHWNQGGFYLEDLPLDPTFTRVIDTRYWLVSLSTAF